LHGAFAHWLARPELANIPKLRLPVADAITLIRCAGGVTSWAHPPQHTDAEMMLELRALGLQAVECIYPWPTGTHGKRLQAMAESLGLAISGGDDAVRTAYLIAHETAVADELLGVDEVLARIIAELGGGLFLAVVEAIDLRPHRPGVVRGAAHGRSRHDLQLQEALAAVPHRRTDAVGAGITTSNHYHILAFSGNKRAILVLIEQASRIAGQELHGKVDSFQIPSFNGQVARFSGAGTKDYAVKLCQEPIRGIVSPDLGVCEEFNTFGFHLIETTHHYLLLIKLHVWDAIHEQSAGSISALENRYPMPRTV
jgi:hypothetical protein